MKGLTNEGINELTDEGMIFLREKWKVESGKMNVKLQIFNIR